MATDAQLVRCTRAGDRQAFGELVDRYRDMAYGLGYHLTGDFERARDLAQEAFLQAYLKLDQLREPSRFSGWLRRITRNAHRMQLRQREVSIVALEDQPTAEHQPSETEAVVREALTKLRTPERLALTLHYVNGYSHAEIGGFLGVNAATVKTRLARARQHLREEVMAMIEDTFEQRALGEEFRRDVVGAVDRLANDLRRALPPELDRLSEAIQSRFSALLRQVREGLPKELGRCAKSGEAIPVTELPEGLRTKLSKAVHWLWVDRILWHLQNYDWFGDAVWIGIEQRAGKERLLSLWDCDPRQPHASLRQMTLPRRVRRYRGEPDKLATGKPQRRPDCGSLLAALTKDVKHAATDLRAKLGARLPAPPAVLYAELQSEFERLAAAWFGALTSQERRRLRAGDLVQAADLGDGAWQLLSELTRVDYLRCVLIRIVAPPDWLSRLAESRIIFAMHDERISARCVRIASPVGTHISLSADFSGVIGEHVGHPSGVAHDPG